MIYGTLDIDLRVINAGHDTYLHANISIIIMS